MKIKDKVARPGNFKERLKEAMDIRGISQTDLVALTGIPKSAISQYLSGAFSPKKDRLSLLAEALNVSEIWLQGYNSPMKRWSEQADNFEEDPTTLEFLEHLEATPPEERKKDVALLKIIHHRGISPIKTKRLPLLGNVACGEPKYADEQLEAYVSADDDIDADFCLRAKGDSMINARIFDGDILFVKCQEKVDDGDIAVVLIDDETTVKRFYHDKENGIITLVPENPTYKTMRYTGAKLREIRVLGKVIQGQYSII